MEKVFLCVMYLFMCMSVLLPLPQVSLTQNCQPPRRSGRAAQMQTIFIALLFFPFFVGAVSMVAFTAWRYEDMTFSLESKNIIVQQQNDNKTIT